MSDRDKGRELFEAAVLIVAVLLMVLGLWF